MSLSLDNDAHMETVALLGKTGDGQENADCGEMR